MSNPLENIVRNLSNRIQEVDLKDSFANVAQGVPVYKVETLPTPGQAGRLAYVNNAADQVEYGVARTKTLAYDDGTNWRRAKDSEVISTTNTLRYKIWPIAQAGGKDGAIVDGFYGAQVLLPDAGFPIAYFSTWLPYDAVPGSAIIVAVLSGLTNASQIELTCYVASHPHGGSGWNVESGVARLLTPTGIGVDDYLSYTITHASIGVPTQHLGLAFIRNVDANTGTVGIGPVAIAYQSNLINGYG